MKIVVRVGGSVVASPPNPVLIDKYVDLLKDLKRQGHEVVAVVGAGHINGIKNYLDEKDFDVDLNELEQIPKKRISIGKIVSVAIPIAFALIVIWLLMSRGSNAWAEIGNVFFWWFIIHGILSAIGAAIARGHPLSILTAFVAAPFTSLEPFFAPGWFAGLVEAKLRTPVIKDFHELRKIESLKDFWNNKVIRLLMVVALANLGSMIGTLVAFPYIASLVF